MPSNLMFADSSFPVIGSGEDPKQSVKKVMNYLYMLLEQLRYTLQNLEPGNFNEAEMGDYFKKLTADVVVAQTVISNTVITNELYAQYGAIADLTVDKLRTDYQKAQRYLDKDLSPLNYLVIQDEQISFRTGVANGSAEEQLTVDGKPFWWTDESKTQMTREKNTGIPVMVFRYEELEKAAFRFAPVTMESGVATVAPVLTFGAGTGISESAGKATIRKNLDGFELRYLTSSGQAEGAVLFRDDGFVDVTARRADVAVDTTAKTITMTPEGVGQADIILRYAEKDSGLALTWPDGKTFSVEVR